MRKRNVYSSSALRLRSKSVIPDFESLVYSRPDEYTPETTATGERRRSEEWVGKPPMVDNVGPFVFVIILARGPSSRLNGSTNANTVAEPVN